MDLQKLHLWLISGEERNKQIPNTIAANEKPTKRLETRILFKVLAMFSSMWSLYNRILCYRKQLAGRQLFLPVDFPEPADCSLGTSEVIVVENMSWLMYQSVVCYMTYMTYIDYIYVDYIYSHIDYIVYIPI